MTGDHRDDGSCWCGLSYTAALPESMTRNVDFYDGPEDPLRSVRLVPVDETEDE